MKRNPTLSINVPAPCNQNWDAMKQSGNGRHCSNCNKVVVDFSHLSDSELFSYFSRNQTIPCGRFHNEQINKIILPPANPKTRWSRYYKVAATLLAFIGMKISATAANKQIASTTISPPQPKRQIILTGYNITINGVVKDEHGQLLENAQVRFGDSIIVKTDHEGRFKIEFVPAKDQGATTLLFSFPGMVSTVRNYHPAMLSTSYDVLLYLPHDGEPSYTMGVPVSHWQNVPPTTIEFSNSTKALNVAAKKALSELALWMRNNPDVIVKVMAYVTDKNSRKAAINFLALVRKHMVDMEGIGVERFSGDWSVVKGLPKNMIEITGQSPY